MFGSHLSIAGGMVNALDVAVAQNMDCVQVFTKNQRQWKAKPLQDSDILSWNEKLVAIGWRGTNRTVSHNSYLINMASPEVTTREKSIALQREEIERCEILNIPFLVSHPGARLGTPRKRGEANQLGEAPSTEELAGLQRIADAMNQLHEELPGYQTVTCLETTVGSGTNLGYDFQHLAWIKEHVKQPERVGFCFDTCHVIAAGYDMSTDKKAKLVLETFEEVAGLQNIQVFHFNDSVGDVGSRLDRHAHIGQGACGLSCFRAILDNSMFDNVPKILETSKEENETGKPMDMVNIRKLRQMAKLAKKHR
jgi:deoxyribonuclease-4|tara:strand:- start:611 stop:1537 length:927 start_codon:yes stop_codon:yes gene_type:complete